MASKILTLILAVLILTAVLLNGHIEDRELKLNQCLIRSQNEYLFNYETFCRSQGLPEACYLPFAIADRLSQEKLTAQALCAKLFGNCP